MQVGSTTHRLSSMRATARHRAPPRATRATARHARRHLCRRLPPLVRHDAHQRRRSTRRSRSDRRERQATRRERSLYPSQAMGPSHAKGTTSYRESEPVPEVCFPNDGTTPCSTLGSAQLGVSPPSIAAVGLIRARLTRALCDRLSIARDRAAVRVWRLIHLKRGSVSPPSGGAHDPRTYRRKRSTMPTFRRSMFARRRNR